MKRTFLSLCAVSIVLVGCRDDPHDAGAGGADAGPTLTSARDAATDAQRGATSDGGVRDSGGAPDAGARADYTTLEAQALSKYKSCGAYEASGDPAPYLVQDSFDACIARCVLAAPCDQIAAALCTDTANTLTICLDRCDPDTLADGFLCRDGSAVPHAYLCDYQSDCPGGEDEQGCGTFTCADGVVLENRLVRCDYFDDCADRSDEKGCALQCT